MVVTAAHIHDVIAFVTNVVAVTTTDASGATMVDLRPKNSEKCPPAMNSLQCYCDIIDAALQLSPNDKPYMKIWQQIKKLLGSTISKYLHL